MECGRIEDTSVRSENPARAVTIPKTAFISADVVGRVDDLFDLAAATAFVGWKPHTP